jgi:hypothetical protein
MNGNTLPQEITDHIIDHLWDDKHALRTCSLVCKAWSFPTRHHLFADVVITYWNFKTTATLGPAVTRCIRNVHLRVLTGTWQSFLEPLIGIKFENAVSLVIDVSRYREPPPFGISGLHDLTPHIVKLCISNLLFETTDKFTEFICAFQCLESLFISGLSCATIVSPSLLSLPDNLRFVWASDNLSTGWLLSFQHLPSIRFTSQGEHDASTSHILRTLGTSLETVCLVCHCMRFSSTEFYSHSHYTQSA